MNNGELAGILREAASLLNFLAEFADYHEFSRPNKIALDCNKAADELEKAEPVGHFYHRPHEGRFGVEWRCEHLDDGAALYTHPPAPQVPDAISALEHELCIMQSTISSYDSPAEALRALIDWHVAVATDPRVGGKATQPSEEG